MFDQYRQRKLERRRQEALSRIRGQQVNFDAVVQRAQITGDAINEAFIATVHQGLAEIAQRASQETDIDELDSLIEDAEQQGQLRAYVCPRAEIADEGNLAIDMMEEWNVPKTVTTRLRNSLGKKLENVDDVAHLVPTLGVSKITFITTRGTNSRLSLTVRTPFIHWLFGESDEKDRFSTRQRACPAMRKCVGGTAGQ